MLELSPDLGLDVLRGELVSGLARGVDAGRVPIGDVDRQDVPDRPVSIAGEVGVRPELALRDRRERPRRLYIRDGPGHYRPRLREVELETGHPARVVCEDLDPGQDGVDLDHRLRHERAHSLDRDGSDVVVAGDRGLHAALAYRDAGDLPVLDLDRSHLRIKVIVDPA